MVKYGSSVAESTMVKADVSEGASQAPPMKNRSGCSNGAAGRCKAVLRSTELDTTTLKLPSDARRRTLLGQLTQPTPRRGRLRVLSSCKRRYASRRTQEATFVTDPRWPCAPLAPVTGL